MCICKYASRPSQEIREADRETDIDLSAEHHTETKKQEEAAKEERSLRLLGRSDCWGMHSSLASLVPGQPHLCSVLLFCLLRLEIRCVICIFLALPLYLSMYLPRAISLSLHVCIRLALSI